MSAAVAVLISKGHGIDFPSPLPLISLDRRFSVGTAKTTQKLLCLVVIIAANAKTATRQDEKSLSIIHRDSSPLFLYIYRRCREER